MVASGCWFTKTFQTLFWLVELRPSNAGKGFFLFVAMYHDRLLRYPGTEVLDFARNKLLSAGLTETKNREKVSELGWIQLLELYKFIFKSDVLKDIEKKKKQHLYYKKHSNGRYTPPSQPKIWDEASVEALREKLQTSLKASLTVKPKKKKSKVESKKEPKLNQAYKDHINSDKWKEFRKTILVKYKHTCQKCNNIFLPRDLHVHHLHYRTFGNEKDEDVKLVCVGCHEKIHGRKFNDLT